MYTKILLCVLVGLFIPGCATIDTQQKKEEIIKKKKFPTDSFIFIKQEALIKPNNCIDDSLGIPFGIPNCKEEKHFLVGSAFIIEVKKNSSIVLTANHVCKEEEDMGNYTKKVIKNTFFDIKKNKYNGKIIATDDSNDLCLLEIFNLVDRSSVKISKKKPSIGDKVFAIGSSAGFFNKNFVPIFPGIYFGDSFIENDIIKNFSFKLGTREKISFYSIFTTPGISGGMIINDDMKVVGLVSLMFPENISLGGATYENLVNFLHKNKVFQ